jgi:hypothetical protein
MRQCNTTVQDNNGYNDLAVIKFVESLLKESDKQQWREGGSFLTQKLWNSICSQLRGEDNTLLRVQRSGSLEHVLHYLPILNKFHAAKDGN